MIILGKNSDDIGCQLERLTRKILEHKGYTDIVVNEVSSGAQEIDVTANFALPLPGKPQRKRLICECKAHRTPISLPEWLKFLGKIYVEETRTSGEISGLFVALSGVNGNVSGNFHELNQHRDNISILSGDQLLEEIAGIYHIFPLRNIIASFERLTSRKYLNIEAAYYEEKIYWVFTFSDEEYTILTSDGSPLNDKDLDTTRLLKESLTPLSLFIDLHKEAEAIARIELLEKHIICFLITCNGASEMNTIKRGITDYKHQEVSSVIDKLKNKGWIKEESGNLSFTADNVKSEKLYDLLCNIIRFFFNSELPIKLFSDFYTAPFLNKRINKFFLRHISKIQGGLPFTEDLKKLTLEILKISPGALLYSITPDPMIITHRTKDPKIINYEFDEFDRQVFKRSLFKQLIHDFEQPVLKEFYFETKGICEIENSQKVLVKSKDKLELQEEFSMRRGIYAAHESIGGGYIQVLVLDNAPQPWENPHSNQTKKK